MNALPIVIMLLASQAKTSPMRTVEVKPCGLALSIPKAWGVLKKEPEMLFSFKIPVTESKANGRFDVGYSSISSGDPDGYLGAMKATSEQLTYAVDKQWKLDVSGSPFAFTKRTKGTETQVVGAYFQPKNAVMLLYFTGPSDKFEQVEAMIQPVLESLRTIKAVKPVDPIALAPERIIRLTPRVMGQKTALPLSAPFIIGDKNYIAKFPIKTVVLSSTSSEISVSIPGCSSKIVMSATMPTPDKYLEFVKAHIAETAKQFSGSVKRIDQVYPTMFIDGFTRNHIFRDGNSAKDGKPLFVSLSYVVNSKVGFVVRCEANGSYNFKSEMALLERFINTLTIEEKK
jgi:hypothetical protein